MDVEAIVSVAIHRLTKLLSEESEIFQKVGNEVQRVVFNLSVIQSILNHAGHEKESSNVLTDRVMEFLGKVYHVEDAIESFTLVETHLKRMGFVKKHLFIKLCREAPDEMDYPESLSRFKSKMNKISKEIQDYFNRISSLASAQHQGSHIIRRHQQSRQEGGAYYAPKTEETIFKVDVEKLLNQINSNKKSLQIISVFGEIGIGKAAHVKTIYRKLELENNFACGALVVMHTEWSVRHLMLAILQQAVTSLMRKVKLNDEEPMEKLRGFLKDKEKLKDEELTGRLHGFLKGQRYLIVINDVTSLDILEKLQGALPDAYNGSRVVITTHYEEVASFADVSSRYHFKPLNSEDGLKIFIRKVWGKKGSPLPNDIMEDLKIKIAESCKGTPMRIAMLAGLLSTRNLTNEDWSSVFAHHEFDTKSPSFDILAFCYNDLPHHMKLCFLHLGLFRKGFEIPVRRLFRLWLAEGFVQPTEGITLEEVVEGYLDELVKRNMVEITKRRSDESPKKCRMIGALHDIFLPRAVKIGLFHLHQKSNKNATGEPQFGVRRLVEYTNIKTYPISKACKQNLHSYISFNGRKKDMPAEEVGTLLEGIIGTRGFGSLKVLDLEGVYRPRLPENLGNLFHLRYLGLRWTFLDTLPSSLGTLFYLETLDIKHTRITSLPSSIWNMKHLRHLCLNEARIDIPAQSTKHKTLSQLQTLWGLYVDEKIARKIGSTLSRMTSLRKLDLTRQTVSTVTTTTITTTTSTTSTTISHSSSYEEIGLWISNLSSLQSLRLRSKDKMGWPSKLILKPFSSLKNLSQLYLLGHLQESLDWYQLPPGLKVLTLSVSQLDKDPMPTLSQLQSLMVLRLLANSYLGEKMLCSEIGGFPSLRILKLWKVEKLNMLTVEDGAMKKLHTLEIRCCTELKELPETLLQRQSFYKLILTDMPEPFVSAVREKTKKHTKIVENK